MANYIRTNTAEKKRKYLCWIEYHLELSILHNQPVEHLLKKAEKYKLAKLSFLKAQIHLIIEQGSFQNPIKLNTQKIEKEVEIWTNKTPKEIIDSINQELHQKKSV